MQQDAAEKQPPECVLGEARAQVRVGFMGARRPAETVITSAIRASTRDPLVLFLALARYHPTVFGRERVRADTSDLAVRVS